jgi:chitin disaccharide deacetylase
LTNLPLTPQLLGYPRDARLLIINIDDVGFCLSANESAVETILNGSATSCTIMLPPAWSGHACRLMNENPQISHGIHLTLISEHEALRWGPLSPLEEVPSLVDKDGYFPLEDGREQLLARAKLGEMEREFRTQIEKSLLLGLRPVQLDSHCNTHDARADIFEMTIRLAQDYGLALRVHEGGMINVLKARGLPVVDHPDVDSYRIPLSNRARTYLRMLHELPAGLSEWAIHCARGTHELRVIDPTWAVRAADYRFFNSKECRQAIQIEGIQLVTYAALQPFWKK